MSPERNISLRVLPFLALICLFQAPGIRAQTSLTAEGYTGLIGIPSTDVMPNGTVGIGFSTKSNPTFAIRHRTSVGRQRNYYFALGFLPRLELGAKLYEVDDPFGKPLSVGDLTANIKFRLLNEGRYHPAVLLGSQDIYGNRFLTSDFILLGKSWRGFRTMAGYGRDRRDSHRLDGLFYGAKASFFRYAAIMAEWDAEDMNIGLRLRPTRRLTADVMVQHRDRFAIAVSYLLDLDGLVKSVTPRFLKKPSNRPPVFTASRSDMPVTSLEAIESACIDQGFENVAARQIDTGTLLIEYENRRYNSNDLEALGIVLGIAGQHAGRDVDTVTVIVKELNIPALRLTTTVDDWLDFVNERLSSPAFAAGVDLTNQVTMPAVRGKNNSRLRTDLVLSPGIQSVFGTEVRLAAARFTLRPDVIVQLGRGTVFDVGGTFFIGSTAPIFDPRVFDKRTGLRRMILHHTIRLPRNVFTQTGVGLFSTENYGISNETLVLMGDGRHFAKGTFALLRDTRLRKDRRLALFTYRYRIPALDITIEATGGQFLDNDRGATAIVSRYFGNNQVNFFARKTDQAGGALVGIGVILPLMPAPDFKPGRFRVRLDNHFEHAQGIRATGGRNSFLRGDIGNPLRTDHEIDTIVFNKDRLYPVYIREHVHDLRRAAYRWLRGDR